MSLPHWSAVVILSAMSYFTCANPLSNSAVPTETSAMQIDISDTSFCREMRSQREFFLTQEADLNKPHSSPEYNLNSFRCFSPAENLFYTAHQEAQKILGLHARWYTEISEDFKDRVIRACENMGLISEEANKAYDRCIESRHQELMGPYENKYQRETEKYIKKRNKTAQALVKSCNMAISSKRSQLPRELKFPIAYHDDLSPSIPSWLIEKNINDSDWLEKLNRPKANKLMHDVLGRDCPGNMVYWVVYNQPEY